ncbi:MAG: hypothetical protein DI628_02880 [Blastochloris viridis]|uniref:HD-GYP domain-containing protein n=1 Tax=Blastochloris viridis TaxID=1079 RepID=A0A6N4RC48_BLAVI|nr:MAG: hypothetical protein DI628_02880 [Blastochloris viridis]
MANNNKKTAKAHVPSLHVNPAEFQSVAYRGAVPLRAFLGWVSLIVISVIIIGALFANLLVSQRLGQLVAETAARVELQAQGRASTLTEWAIGSANLGKTIERAEVVRIFSTESARLASPANAPQMEGVSPDMIAAVMQQKPYMQQLLEEFVSRNGLNGAQLLLPNGKVLLSAGTMPRALPANALQDVVRQSNGQILPLTITGEGTATDVAMDVLRPVNTLGTDDNGPVVAVLWYNQPVGEKIARLLAATQLDREGERTALVQHVGEQAQVVGRNALGNLPDNYSEILSRLAMGGDTVRVVQPSMVDSLPVFATLRQIPGTPFAVLQEYSAKSALGIMALYKPGIYLIITLGMIVVAALMLALTLHLMGQRNRTRVKLLGQTMEALVRVVEARDPFLSGHHAKVARLAVQVGNRTGLGVGERATLYYAAQLASVGRMLVPQAVMAKKGKLTDAERQTLEDHINQAVAVLGDIEFDLPIMPVISQMYEREDGTGHPLGLKAERINRMAKVLGACDAFVAMTSDRAHRKAMTKAEALKAMSTGAFASDITAAIKSEKA